MFGNKDTDGFYRAEIWDRVGLIPCNMVSEIQTEDDEMMDQLLKQGFLPLNTPVEKLGEMLAVPDYLVLSYTCLWRNNTFWLLFTLFLLYFTDFFFLLI